MSTPAVSAVAVPALPSLAVIALGIFADVEGFMAGAPVPVTEDLPGGYVMTTTVTKSSGPATPMTVFEGLSLGFGAYEQLVQTGSATVPPFTVKLGSMFVTASISIAKAPA